MTHTTSQLASELSSLPADPPAAERGPGASTTLSAEQVHIHAVEAHRVGNRGRLALAQALRILHESEGYKALGHSRVSAYTDATFRIGRSETYAMIRVARALNHLPRCLEAFAEGKISWTCLRAIADVASEETEQTWLEFASRQNTQRLLSEAREAKRKQRDAPREGGYGLPALTRRISLRFSPSEYEKVRQVLEIYGRGPRENSSPFLGVEAPTWQGATSVVYLAVLERGATQPGGMHRRPEMGSYSCAGPKRAAEKLGSEDVSLEQALLFVCEQLLGEEAESGEEERSRPLARYALIYQACPECRRAGVHTPEGLVEVGEEEIERIAGETDLDEVATAAAMTTTTATATRGESGPGSPDVSPPTPSSLRRRILLRDGALCANPFCSNPADHVHHVRFRSEGGATAAENLVAVCRTCHAAIHAGLLRVSGPAGDLRWQPRSEGLAGSRLRHQAVAADALPLFRIESAAAESVLTESTAVDSADTLAVTNHEEDVVATLRNLGWSTAQARSRARKAAALLGEAPHTLENLIRTALSGRFPSRQSTGVDSIGRTHEESRGWSSAKLSVGG